MRNGSRVLNCAGCQKHIRVGMGVAWVLCAECARNLASVWDRLKPKKVRRKHDAGRT